MRSDARLSALASIFLLGCSLDTDLIREPDGSIDATNDATSDASDASLDVLDEDASNDSSVDGSELDAGVDACGPEICDGVDDDCDGRVDESSSDCAGACVDATCTDSGEILWYATIGSTSTGVARDRVFGLTATETTVFAVGDAQGDELSWTRTAELLGADGFLAGMNATGGTSLATMSSAGGDVARDVVLDDGELRVVGVVTGTATFGEGMSSTAGTTGFFASYAPDAEVAATVERLGQTSDLEAVATTSSGHVAVGPIRGRLEHPGCPTLDAPGIGIAWSPGRWCTVLGTSGDEVFPHDVAAGPAGAVYVVGTVSGTATIGGATVDGGTGSAAFVLKLDDEDGVIDWVRSIESVSAAAVVGGNAVAVADDLVIVGGQAADDAVVTAGGASIGSFSVADEDPYLVAFDDTGALAWTLVDAQSFSGGVLALAVDRDALFVAGWHGGVSWGCEDPIATVPGNGEDAFVARLDSSTRACRWVRGVGSSMLDRTHALAVDPIRDVVYAGGELSNGATIRGETITTNASDGFVIAYAR